METVIAWILSFMVSTAPPGRPTFYVEAQETQADALIRYESIANDIVGVVYDKDTKPLFKGEQGRARTVSVMLSLMLFESGFRKNVDFGLGKHGRGDAGKSWCLLQLNVGRGKTIRWNTKEDRLPRSGDKPEDIHPGFTGEELVQDRKKCITAGLRGLRVSFASCPKLSLDQKLRVYGSGSCEKGAKESALRMNAAVRFWDRTKDKRTWKDSDVVVELSAKKSPLTPKGTEDLSLQLPAKRVETAQKAALN